MNSYRHLIYTGGGCGIYWRDLDGDLGTEGLLRGAPAPKPVGVVRGRSALAERKRAKSANNKPKQIAVQKK